MKSVVEGPLRAASAVAFVVAVGGSAHAWVRTLEGSRASADTLSLAAATHDGDLVTLGCPQGLVRLDGRTGGVRWQRDAQPSARYCPAAPGSGALVVAQDGTIVVAGGGVTTTYDGASGATRWIHEVEGARDDDPGALVSAAIDPAGDVVVAGFLDQSGDEDSFDANFLVEKLAGADGHVVWRALFDGSPRPLPDDCDGGCDPPGDPFDFASAVTVLDDGLVVAGGAIERDVAPHFAVIALDGATGVEAWRWESAEPGQVSAVARDAGGVVVAGRIGGKPALLAFTSTGAPRWETSVPGGDDADRWATVVVAGEVLVAGRAGGRPTIARYTTAGAFVWRREALDRGEAVALVPGATDVAAVLALDAPSLDRLGRWRVWSLDAGSGATRWIVDPADGRPVAAASGTRALLVAGTSETPATFRDGTVVALDHDDGTERWRRVFDTPPRTQGDAEAIAVAPNGDVIAAGTLWNSDTLLDFVVTALSPHTGRVRWQRDLNGTPSYRSHDRARAVQVDARGDVVTAGDLQEHTLVKLDGATGAERWRAAANDRTENVAIDAAGDVIAVGELDRGFDVSKHDGETGVREWRHTMPSGFAAEALAAEVAVLADGDVLAGGFVQDEEFRRSKALVQRLAGIDGTVVWERRFGDGMLASVTGSEAGVVVGADLTDFAAVVSLDPATGDERWRATFPNERRETVLLDGRGDVVACSESPVKPYGTVRKLDRTTGETRWEWQGSTDYPYWSPAIVCALTPGDDVAVSFPVTRADARSLGAAVLAGTTGMPRWERWIPTYLDPFAIATDRAGNLFVANDHAPFDGFTVVGLDGTSGSPRPTRVPRSGRRASHGQSFTTPAMTHAQSASRSPTLR